MYKNILYLTIYIISATLAQDNLRSICPEVFRYNIKKSQDGQWFGTILTHSDFSNYTVEIVLGGGIATFFGASVGDVTTKNNIKYLINIREHPNESTKRIDIFAKYDILSPAPQVLRIRFLHESGDLPVCEKPNTERLIYLSDCQNSYKVKHIGITDNDIFFGQINLVKAPADNGYQIQLDRPGDFGTSFGKVSFDKKENIYTISNITANSNGSVTIPYYIKYNQNTGIPKIMEIDANEIPICNKGYDENTFITVQQINSTFKNTWTGTLNIEFDERTVGVRCVVILDKPVKSIAASWGDIKHTMNNDYFLISNPKFEAMGAISIQFLVQYSNNIEIPKVIGVYVNADHFYENLKNRNTNMQITTNPTKSPILDSLFNFNEDAGDDFKCGTINIGDKIFYGSPSSIANNPWHGTMFVSGRYSCGLTLISRRHALTAAHCFYGAGLKKIEKDSISVRFGISNLNNITESAQTANISEIKLHPNYVFHESKFDIALLKFDQDVKVTDTVKPVCLWEGDTSLRSIENRNGVIIGFGLTEVNVQSEKLLRTEIKIVDSETCRELNPTFYGSFLSSNSFCAGNLTGATVCRGDSGGGLFLQKPNSDAWQIRGITSTSRKSLDLSSCDNNIYAIFTDVAKFLDWIAVETKL